MTDNFIQLEKSDVLTLKIRTADGKETGEVLTFDLEDIELPLRYQELQEANKKNHERLRNQMLIIEKRQDVKGKKLLTKNQEDEINAFNEFYKREAEIYNMFLGENGVQKLLNGRKLGWTSLKSIDKIIKTQIAPYLDLTMDNIKNKVKEKYGTKEENEIEIVDLDEKN